MAGLTRYWITFDYPPFDQIRGAWQPVGFGVTALGFEDAMGILRREWFERHDLDVPPVREVVEDVDVSQLDDHVRPNMHPPNWRGMWFPTTGPLR